RNVVETKMAELGIKPNVMLEVDGVSAILDVLASTRGYAILPLYAVAIYSKSGDYHFQRIIEPRLESQLSLVTSSRRPFTPTQNAVMNLVLEICREVLIPSIDEETHRLIGVSLTSNAK